MDDMPIISFRQAADTIIYGYDFDDYREAEFLTSTENIVSEGMTDGIFEKLKSTGIWYHIIESYIASFASIEQRPRKTAVSCNSHHH
jgi:hypothetical protein